MRSLFSNIKIKICNKFACVRNWKQIMNQ